MAFSWVQVGGTGYDVEEIPNPRTVELTCPACERPVRFVEKLLVKNLKVFGVPLVGLERGRPVFECPRCSACIETESDAKAIDAKNESTSSGNAPPATLTQLLKQIEQAEFDVELWRKREALARERGDDDLRDEARSRRESAEERVSLLRDDVNQYDASGRRKVSVGAPGSAKVVFRAGDAAPADSGAAGSDTQHESAFAALKARLLRRKQDDDATASSESSPAENAAAKDTANSAGDATSGTNPTDAVANAASGGATTAAAGIAMDAGHAAPSNGSAPAADDAEIEDDFARLKDRLARRKSATEAFASLPGESNGESAPRDESSVAHSESTGTGSTPSTEPAGPNPSTAPREPRTPEASTDSPPPETDDDPMAALKKRLRKGPT